jgi:hypothetical protein
MIPIIYYAHSMTIYGTEREQKELRQLEDHFSHMLIYNPNRRYIQESKNPMVTCLKIVKDPWITGLVFSHTQRKVSSGVYDEIKAAQKRYKPIYIIENDRVRQYVGVIKLTKKDRATNWAEV